MKTKNSIVPASRLPKNCIRFTILASLVQGTEAVVSTGPKPRAFMLVASSVPRGTKKSEPLYREVPLDVALRVASEKPVEKPNPVVAALTSAWSSTVGVFRRAS